MTLIGKAWRGVQRFVQDIRIDADFPRYEQELRAAHESTANRRFDTAQLEREIESIWRTAEADGCAAYGTQIRQLESSINALQPEISKLRTQLELLSRDYRRELDDLYAKKASLLDTKQVLFEQMKALQQERSAAQAELNEAYDDLNEAKSSIESWHAKSERTPWLFGNGGKELPDHSLFGQSFGDLDGYKADRARACDDIGSCKAAIAEIAGRQKTNRTLHQENKANLNRVFESISTAKGARQRMFDLRDQGVRRHRVEAELTERVRQEAALQKDLNHQRSAMAEFVEQQAIRLGIEERKRAVSELREKRSLYLVAFDAPEQRAARQQAHREWWLAGREAA
ncbi:DNA repair exonuclease SbcCD ATPase subunit [Pelomonas aquatica]|uniref:DNA repair exonuclease SbcCD ATPase subunit n=1 Tax=Pelomonas aquatica TaxID=431058 RepID=A0ABU1ZGD6_9BURK|nr:hypothetical protein [Pelomonas aquatica]MDR7299025.1 DNA repair exonuclease SbcCD ATPase subunit [Pelomonas aquatica]